MKLLKYKIHYKVVDSKGKILMRYFGFSIGEIEKKYPHHRIIKTTSHHFG